MDKERRHYPRVYCLGVVDYSGLSGVNCLSIKNLSRGGIRLVLDGAEKPGRLVRLRLTINDAAPFALRGRIVWARQRDPFEIGIRFLEEDEHLVEVLDHLD